ncbi:hypothetical protein CLOLEP_00306 [[Clostridium] leptum DSM 753]|uniref:Uncharacterized protein n=1 Tax=[Clostridium] leptum DSM 753 TaxID=428125 RepID=A7VP30_9FIRM|nr:hypothetical protein CLOLEP_00306 [[Clostridium] leptum DSM 753]
MAELNKKQRQGIFFPGAAFISFHSRSASQLLQSARFY